jgi:fructose-bisphosphate aldolase, class I
MCKDDELLEMARTVVLHGASGFCIGRNVLQRESAAPILNRLRKMVLEASSAPPAQSPFTGPSEWICRAVLCVAND